MPKVSVIIPTYNRAALLPETIQSILNQDYQHFEVVIVDDGSTDNTRNVVGALREKDDRIIYIYQEHKGVAVARNTGCLSARGEYLAFLDSDDRALPGRLKESVEILDANRNVGIVYGTVLVQDNNSYETQNNSIAFPGVIPCREMFMKLLHYHLFFKTPTVTMRKEVFDRYRFDHRMEIGEDLLFFLQASRDYLFYGVDKNFAVIRTSHSSLMKKDRYRFDVKLALDILKKDKHHTLPLDGLLYLQSVSSLYLYYAKVAFEKDARKHLFFLIKAFFYFPFNLYIYKHILGTVLLRRRKE